MNSAFTRNIAMHPETWLDFPLDEEEDLGNFDLSDVQQEHAMSDEVPFIDKSVIEEKPIIKSEDKNLTVGPSSKMLDNIYEDDDDDDWPEEDSELDGYSGTATHAINEEDISFSDLEDDDFLAPTKLKTVSKE
ncbi:hypothetical protein D8674_032490 [Pyrus ussuriensis x Pyrus communis]|uniref:Uncharacterized protein n=1 Tax=Pyrus ussuriensis x Pyrus communis TaxID=2448454 RepID=A0A5N5HIN7_9ROSA|nr:hypothetical protein D8674_032490 [Pyrus ussuriensis x Pyrus communis]